jgi:Fe-S-cluster containining protein
MPVSRTSNRPAPSRSSSPASRNRTKPRSGQAPGAVPQARAPQKIRLPLAGATPPPAIAKGGRRASGAPGPAPRASSKFDCSHCGLCCTYLAIEIDGPTTVKRATELLWYLYHEDVSIYVNEDDWMVQFETRCRYLTVDRKCGIYATRPHICREFSEQECEVNTGDDGHTFYNATQFMEHLKQTRPRVWTLVNRSFAPPPEPPSKPGSMPSFQRRLRDVHARRNEMLRG